MGHVSHKLNNAFEGALAGGGDPATSPLYVLGPFLRLIVVAGVAEITFRTNAAAKAIQILREKRPDMLVGAGTVLTMDL